MEFTKDKVIDEMQNMYDNGVSYMDIAERIREKYGVIIHTETVRYHVKRKRLSKKTEVEKLQEQGIEKILVISDLHIPHHRDDVLDIITKHKDEISKIVFNGDTIDCEEISKFVSLGKGKLISEMASCHSFLKAVDDLTPNIEKVLVLGNHENRMSKYMASNANALNNLHTGNILREITDGFKDANHEKGTVTYYDKLSNYTVLDTWYYTDKGIIYCHPLSFSKIPARTAYNAVEYFVRNNFVFDTVLVAHTHHFGICKNLGKYCVETGSLCKPQDYASSGRLNYTPQDSGYHLVVLKDGKYDVNESRNFLLLEEN